MLRVVKDGHGHVIDRDGKQLHTKVRYQIDADHRVAVFLSPSQGPSVVYGPDTVTIVKVGVNCSHPVCYGKASRQKLTRLWEQSEVVHV